MGSSTTLGESESVRCALVHPNHNWTGRTGWLTGLNFHWAYDKQTEMSHQVKVRFGIGSRSSLSTHFDLTAETTVHIKTAGGFHPAVAKNLDLKVFPGFDALGLRDDWWVSWAFLQLGVPMGVWPNPHGHRSSKKTMRRERQGDFVIMTSFPKLHPVDETSWCRW